jgi:hypothetical protein
MFTFKLGYGGNYGTGGSGYSSGGGYGSGVSGGYGPSSSGGGIFIIPFQILKLNLKYLALKL